MELDLQLDRYVPTLKIRRQEGIRQVFDPLRQQWLVLQPEEFVRQLLIQYLIQARGYNRNRLAVERGLRVNSLQKRTDLLVYDRQMQPFLLVECKAPEVPLTEDVFRQAGIYNLPLRVPYVLISNGRQSYCCRLDYEDRRCEFLCEVPEFAGREKGG